MLGWFMNSCIPLRFWQTNSKISVFLWDSSEYITNFKWNIFGNFTLEATVLLRFVFLESCKKFVQKIFCKEIFVSKLQKRKKYHFLAFSKNENHASTVASRDNCEKCSHLEIYNILSRISRQTSKCNEFLKTLQWYMTIIRVMNLPVIQYRPLLG